MHLDVATRNGRVRPVWAAGFAGNPSGFSGSGTITIAVVDTGIDAAHTDLAGRQIYWHDFSSDGASSPVDVVGHGSHVSGIAFGTGAASGSATGTLYYTDTGDLTGVPNGSFYPSLIYLPNSTITYSSTARWIGGNSTSLYQVYRSGSSWYAISSPASGSSPLTEINTFVGSTAYLYSAALLSNGSMGQYVITNSVTNYPGIGDGFNKLRGVAPGCNWAMAKVFTNAGSGVSTSMSAALDDLTTTRVANNIKVINMSVGIIGNPGIDTTLRSKVNTAVNNGIVVVVSAGNDGKNSTAAQREIDDPGRAAMVITVAASNDNDQLTDYTSTGFSSPGSDEDYKPDIMAPGGSANYYTPILSVDSGSADGPSFADQQSNDYTNMQGTSMASPFAAGAAALIIDALQQKGITWDFYSSQHARYVKMLLCATASETNMNRESSSYNPTLQRAGNGPNGFPASKDQYEGYGILNPDAAVEAASLVYTLGSSDSNTLGPGVYDRRVWARKMILRQGQTVAATLTVPSGGDFDLYLYSSTPGSTGTPTILASSTQAGNDTDETINYVPPADANALIVVKRVSGSGAFVLTTQAPPSMRTLTVTASASGTVTTPGIGDFNYTDGNVAALFASANANYHFVNWTGTAVTAGKVADPNSPATTVTMNSNYTVQANFAIDQRSLTTTATTGGTVSTPGIGTYWYNHGTDANIIASATTGYHFVNWTGDTNSISDVNAAITTITMDANYTVQANFGTTQFLIHASAGANGSISPSGDITKDYGSSQIFNATPATGYDVNTWYVDDSPVQSGGITYNLTNITAAHTVSVTFKIQTFTVTAGAGANGTVTPLSEVVNYNGSQLFTASPNIGYEVNEWTVDGNSTQSGGTAYTLSNITAAHTVGVTFSRIILSISGYVVELDGNTPVEGVLIAAESNDINTVTDVNGYYKLLVDYNWSGVVAAGKKGYVFEPNINTYANITQNHSDVNYTATLLTYKIAGYVFGPDHITPVSDVNVSAENGGGPWTSRYGGGATIADANGYYEVIVDYNWSGKVTPAKYAYAFEPNGIIYADVNSDWTNQEYIATLLTFKISGYIRNECNTPIVEVMVSADNSGGQNTTDANGYYEVWVSYAWSGSVTPEKQHYTFNPVGLSYADVLADQPDQNYAANNIYDLDCNGSIGLGDLSVLADNWLMTGPQIKGDFVPDEIINFLDFAEFGSVW